MADALGQGGRTTAQPSSKLTGLRLANMRSALGTALLALILSSPAAGESVTLKEDSGTFVVPVLINGKITLDFLVDSGASEVSIPVDVFLTLQRTETISEGDLLMPGVYTLADGSVRRAVRFRIKTLKVGSIEVHDVVASVAPAQGSLLLGQTFLSRMRSWSMDNDRHLLILNEGPQVGSRSVAGDATQTFTGAATASKREDSECGAAQNICKDSASSAAAASLCSTFRREFALNKQYCSGVYDRPPPDRSCVAALDKCGNNEECLAKAMQSLRAGDPCPDKPSPARPNVGK